MRRASDGRDDSYSDESFEEEGFTTDDDQRVDILYKRYMSRNQQQKHREVRQPESDDEDGDTSDPYGTTDDELDISTDDEEEAPSGLHPVDVISDGEYTHGAQSLAAHSVYQNRRGSARASGRAPRGSLSQRQTESLASDSSARKARSKAGQRLLMAAAAGTTTAEGVAYINRRRQAKELLRTAVERDYDEEEEATEDKPQVFAVAMDEQNPGSSALRALPYNEQRERDELIPPELAPTAIRYHEMSTEAERRQPHAPSTETKVVPFEPNQSFEDIRPSTATPQSRDISAKEVEQEISERKRSAKARSRVDSPTKSTGRSMATPSATTKSTSSGKKIATGHNSKRGKQQTSPVKPRSSVHQEVVITPVQSEDYGEHVHPASPKWFEEPLEGSADKKTSGGFSSWFKTTTSPSVPKQNPASPILGASVAATVTGGAFWWAKSKDQRPVLTNKGFTDESSASSGSDGERDHTDPRGVMPPATRRPFGEQESTDDSSDSQAISSEEETQGVLGMMQWMPFVPSSPKDMRHRKKKTEVESSSSSGSDSSDEDPSERPPMPESLYFQRKRTPRGGIHDGSLTTLSASTEDECSVRIMSESGTRVRAEAATKPMWDSKRVMGVAAGAGAGVGIHHAFKRFSRGKKAKRMSEHKDDLMQPAQEAQIGPPQPEALYQCNENGVEDQTFPQDELYTDRTADGVTVADIERQMKETNSSVARSPSNVNEVHQSERQSMCGPSTNVLCVATTGAVVGGAAVMAGNGNTEKNQGMPVSPRSANIMPTGGFHDLPQPPEAYFNEADVNEAVMLDRTAPGQDPPEQRSGQRPSLLKSLSSRLRGSKGKKDNLTTMDRSEPEGVNGETIESSSKQETNRAGRSHSLSRRLAKMRASRNRASSSEVGSEVNEGKGKSIAVGALVGTGAITTVAVGARQLSRGRSSVPRSSDENEASKHGVENPSVRNQVGSPVRGRSGSPKRRRSPGRMLRSLSCRRRHHMPTGDFRDLPDSTPGPNPAKEDNIEVCYGGTQNGGSIICVQDKNLTNVASRSLSPPRRPKSMVRSLFRRKSQSSATISPSEMKQLIRVEHGLASDSDALAEGPVGVKTAAIGAAGAGLSGAAVVSVVAAGRVQSRSKATPTTSQGGVYSTDLLGGEQTAKARTETSSLSAPENFVDGFNKTRAEALSSSRAVACGLGAATLTTGACAAIAPCGGNDDTSTTTEPTVPTTSKRVTTRITINDKTKSVATAPPVKAKSTIISIAPSTPAFAQRVVHHSPTNKASYSIPTGVAKKRVAKASINGKARGAATYAKPTIGTTTVAASRTTIKTNNARAVVGTTNGVTTASAAKGFKSTRFSPDTSQQLLERAPSSSSKLGSALRAQSSWKERIRRQTNPALLRHAVQANKRGLNGTLTKSFSNSSLGRRHPRYDKKAVAVDPSMYHYMDTSADDEESEINNYVNSKHWLTKNESEEHRSAQIQSNMPMNWWFADACGDDNGSVAWNGKTKKQDSRDPPARSPFSQALSATSPFSTVASDDSSDLDPADLELD